MLDPDDIASQVLASARSVASNSEPQSLSGKTVMVTAGPTREAIDPVRYITNRSSGKMGYSMAVAARDAGADVILVSGPVGLPKPDNMTIISIETAEQMLAAVHDKIETADILIAVAAVADYRPKQVRNDKIKKAGSRLTLELVETPDVLLSVAVLEDGPFCVGFAAETEKLGAHAREKLARKKLDMIIANQVGAGLGFDSDQNAVDVYWRSGEKKFPASSKSALAVELITLISERYQKRKQTDAKNVIDLAAARGD